MEGIGKEADFLKTEKFYVAGVTHYEDNILSLGCENEDYNLSNRDLIDGFMEGERCASSFRCCGLEDRCLG